VCISPGTAVSSPRTTANGIQVRIEGVKDLGSVDSVSKVVKLLGSDDFFEFHRHTVKDFSKETLYRFPFGIWFRGQANARWGLVPAVFRRRDFDESSMFHHFQIRAPEYRSSHRSVFDWLCLMQHYNLPTRLLDWSESILVALFFAAQGSGKSDGKVYALNARRLNFLTNSRIWIDGERANVCTPWSLDVAARAQLTVTKTRSEWLDRMSSLSDMESWRTLKCQKIAEKKLFDPEALATPTGVLPSRLNGRMVFQSSAFTLHGGKSYFRKPGMSSEAIPQPRRLEDIEAEQTDPGKQFLLCFTVPGSCKDGILRELLLLGIHPGALFPEVDRQAESIRWFWQLSEVERDAKLFASHGARGK
jgi:hypothetical protein